MVMSEIYSEAFQSLLERKLVRVRYLMTKGAMHRLGIRDFDSAIANQNFLQECHAVYKKAQSIMTTAMLAMESEIKRLSGQPEVHKLKYWLRLFESCFESFVWIALSGGDVSEVYKGPKFGDLVSQNIASVLGYTKHFNENPYSFSIPLDFTRYSCIADVLTVEISETTKKATVNFIELKEGAVNGAMLAATETHTSEAWKEFLDKYGEKGFKQAERFFRAGLEFHERNKQINAAPGVYKTKKGARIVAPASNTPQRFTSRVEHLCDLARRGDYAVEIIDECLLVAALDTSERTKYLRAQFDARLLALNAFITEEDTSKWEPDRIVSALKQVEFTNWIDGVGYMGLFPALLRPITTRNFLDLCFGRVELLFYFHAPNFLHRCRLAGLHAGFLSKKRTNRLRAKQGWRSQDYPLWDGRAMAYMIDGHPMVMGSMRQNDMIFNWLTPSSAVETLVSSNSNMPADSFARLNNLTEKDLEDR